LLVESFLPQGFASANARKGEEMLQTFRRLLSDDAGATAIEYGLICAAIALAIITLLQTLGTNLVALLTGLLAAFG
jgi:pilus assembly protein Flp/PilA